MKKTLLLSILAAGMHAASAYAGLGWTLAECKQHYGKQTEKAQTVDNAGRTEYSFESKGYYVSAWILNGTVQRIMYVKSGTFDLAGVQNLLESNAPDATWGDAEKDDTSGSYRSTGTVNGEEAYYAGVTSNGKVLIIWTKADNDALQASSKDEDKDL